MSDNYSIKFQSLSREIRVGRINKNRTRFLDHEDVTLPAIKAVCEYVLAHYGDDGMFLSNGDDHFEIDVKRVAKREEA